MQAELAALVGSRICHDLVSPIGAISNGVELLAMTQNSAGEEMALIKQSVESAAARLRFFRIAYGLAANDQSIRGKEVQSILSAVAETGRVQYDWQVEGDLPRDITRCAFLLIQALETALPLGGTIVVSGNADAVTMRANGRKTAFDAELWGPLSDGEVPAMTTASQVQFALLAHQLTASQRTVTVTDTGQDILAQF